jgi:redox-sensitive bicupin YhaK (pirin superfamily)
VNLPAEQKMSQPRYQEVTADTIPIIENQGIKVCVVAGQYDGVRGPVTEIAAQPLYMDVTLEPGTVFSIPISEEHFAIAYVFEGKGYFGIDEDGHGELIEAVRMLIFEDGDDLEVKASADSSVRFMLMAGAPFKEPIAPYGPFVMNTQEEIQQAFIDLRNGTFVENSKI